MLTGASDTAAVVKDDHAVLCLQMFCVCWNSISNDAVLGLKLLFKNSMSEIIAHNCYTILKS